VANKRDRAALARAALLLSPNLRPSLPALVLMTDDERLACPLAAARTLPRGSLVVLRSQDSIRRADLAAGLARIARARDLQWIVAGDAELASRAHADGVHFSERSMSAAFHWRARRPDWFITCAAHSLAACIKAAQSGVDAVFLAPVFPTASHPGRACLSPLRLRCIAQLSRVPVYALGGIDAVTVARLKGAPLAGVAAVGALSV
jgi:thiamine-phosphate pyrophosphorylase